MENITRFSGFTRPFSKGMGTQNKIRIISKNTNRKPINRLENTIHNGQKRKANDVKKGDTVQHEKFGKGLIEKIEGAGADEKATIYFKEKGHKRVLLRFAKLKVVKS